ncbi:MAG TPA: BREX-3 system P-loop-containing protein BrxF, partial [Longimicrobiaceae bacterium]|nr:BREX-3 system P-loop-containing protein BrxF [Longimicrobiaceae bacterium]
SALREVAQHTGARLVNVTLKLSRLLIDLPDRQRPHRLAELLEQLIAAAEGDAVLLDHLELLFLPALEQDPLRLLKQLSRGRALAAAWLGWYESGYLVYAEPGHAEYRRDAAHEVVVVELTAAP